MSDKVPTFAFRYISPAGGLDWQRQLLQMPIKQQPLVRKGPEAEEEPL